MVLDLEDTDTRSSIYTGIIQGSGTRVYRVSPGVQVLHIHLRALYPIHGPVLCIGPVTVSMSVSLVSYPQCTGCTPNTPPTVPRGTPLSSLLTVPGLLWYGSGYRPVGRSTSNHWDTRGERGGMWGGVTPGYPHPPHTYPPPSVFPVPRTPPTPPSPSRSWCSPEAPSCTSTWKVTRAN